MTKTHLQGDKEREVNGQTAILVERLAATERERDEADEHLKIERQAKGVTTAKCLRCEYVRLASYLLCPMCCHVGEVENERNEARAQLAEAQRELSQAQSDRQREHERRVTVQGSAESVEDALKRQLAEAQHTLSVERAAFRESLAEHEAQMAELRASALPNSPYADETIAAATSSVMARESLRYAELGGDLCPDDDVTAYADRAAQVVTDLRDQLAERSRDSELCKRIAEAAEAVYTLRDDLLDIYSTKEWSTLIGLLDDRAAMRDAAAEPEPVLTPQEALLHPLRRVMPCGCVACVCQNEERCYGCGASSCPAHDPQAQAEALEAALDAECGAEPEPRPEDEFSE